VTVQDHGVGPGILRFRLSNGMTHAMLAAHVGVSERAVKAWEKGKRQPTEEHLRETAAVFGVRVETLRAEIR
jgi:DNA-binding XRE family transcriptional regulator